MLRVRVSPLAPAVEREKAEKVDVWSAPRFVLLNSGRLWAQRRRRRCVIWFLQLCPILFKGVPCESVSEGLKSGTCFLSRSLRGKHPCSGRPPETQPETIIGCFPARSALRRLTQLKISAGIIHKDQFLDLKSRNGKTRFLDFIKSAEKTSTNASQKPSKSF